MQGGVRVNIKTGGKKQRLIFEDNTQLKQYKPDAEDQWDSCTGDDYRRQGNNNWFQTRP